MNSTATQTPALEVSGLGVRLGGADVLSALDLTLEPGEHVLLVGRSGSGKSTLLRAIAGLQDLESGSIRLAGRSVAEGGAQRVAPEERGVGYLFQEGALWPHWNARKTLVQTLAWAGCPRSEREARAAELLGSVGLQGLERRRPGQLSGGEAQRLALARALAVRPALLLLDEPLGPLDAELRDQLLDLLDRLRREQGFACLHVTHDPAEAARIAARTLRMDGGRLVTEPKA